MPHLSIAICSLCLLLFLSDNPDDGIRVRDLNVETGLSIDYLRSEFGPERSRYEGYPTSRTNHVWDLGEDGWMTGEFDDLGSLTAVTITTGRDDVPDPNSFAVLSGREVRLSQMTLGEVQRAYPNGCLGEVIDGEGYSIRDYHVTTGPEGTWRASFGVSADWEDYDPANGMSDQTVKSITFDFVPDPEDPSC